MNTAQRRDMVVVAASAGGIEALRDLLSRLPGNLPASLLVVLHIPPSSGGALANVLNRSGPLSASAAKDGEDIRPGHVYVAPPDCHLLIEDGRVKLSHGPRQNGHRPAADPLFSSAADACGMRVLAVVLSGTLDDGATGAAVVERCGGLIAVQDPAESAYPGMPRAALAATQHPKVLSVPEIAGLIVRESQESVASPRNNPANPANPTDPSHLPGIVTESGPAASRPPGEWSGLTCPECGGPLHYSTAVRPGRYECRVGHGWSPASLLNGHAAAVEQALWVATLRLDERNRLTQHMADEADKRGHLHSAAGFREAARQAGDALVTIRGLLERAGVSQNQDDET
ncbi:MAG TPA: chemotaxis protein CheB [Streptosporangiaceae bacterium]|nr:chemotaxis protein CheB [Streptosporangiaceae bacterium]